MPTASEKLPLYIFGWPSFVGGADTELAKLFGQSVRGIAHGGEPTLIRTAIRRDIKQAQRAGIGCAVNAIGAICQRVIPSSESG